MILKSKFIRFVEKPTIMSKIPIHFQIAELVMDILKQGSHRKTVQDKLDSGVIMQVENDMKSFQLENEIFISSADVYEDLSIGAIKLIIRIQKELKMNNPLWDCGGKEKRETRAALAQLKKKQIIYPISNTNIFIVNPIKIRKGRPLAVYGALYDYSKGAYEKDKNWKPSADDIHRLMAPKELSITAMAFLPET